MSRTGKIDEHIDRPLLWLFEIDNSWHREQNSFDIDVYWPIEEYTVDHAYTVRMYIVRNAEHVTAI